MKLIRRFLGIENEKKDSDLERRAAETEKLITEERQNLRQNIQRSESASRLISQWDGAMLMMRERK